jgi:hypothetical protein
MWGLKNYIHIGYVDLRNEMKQEQKCEISDFCRGVVEAFALFRCYAA